MPNDFSTKATTLSSIISASAPNLGIGLGMVDNLGRPLKVGEAHSVELGFAEFSLSASDGTASHAFEIISESGIHYKSDASNLGNISQHLFDGSVQIGNASHTGDTFTVYDGLSYLDGGIDVNSQNFTVGTDGALLSVADVQFTEAAASTIGANFGASSANLAVTGDTIMGGLLHVFGNISSSADISGVNITGSGIGSFDTLEVGAGYASNGLSVDTDGNLSMSGVLIVGDTSDTGNSVINGNLEVKEHSVLATAEISNLGLNHIAFSSDASGTVTGDANLTWDASTLSVTGDVSISGDLSVSGNVVQEDSIVVTFEDTILELGKPDSGTGAYPSDASSTLDLGLKLHYNDGSDKLAGIIWERSDAEFKLLSDMADNATADDEIDAFTAYGNLQIANLQAVDGQFSGNADITGNLVVDGNITLGDDATTSTGDTLTISAEIQSSLLPNGSVNLGEASREWATLFAANGILSGGLTFNGASTGTSTITIKDSQADALSILDAGNTDAMVFDSANDVITFGYAIDASGSTITSNLTEHSIVHVGLNGLLEEDTSFRFDGSDFMIGASGSEVFSVAVTSGNTAIAGTLSVADLVTLTSAAAVYSAPALFSNAVADVEMTGSVAIGSKLAVYDDVDFKSALDVAGEATLASAIVSDLTDDRIVIAGSSSELEDDADFRFNGTSFLIGDNDGGTAGGTFNVVASSGNTFVGGTLDVESTSAFADTIALDGTLASNRVITSADVGMSISTTDSAAFAPSMTLISAGAFNIDATGALDIDSDAAVTMGGTTIDLTSDSANISLVSAVDTDIESAGHLRLTVGANEQIMLDNLEVMTIGAVANEQGISSELSMATSNDPDSSYSSELILSLVDGYLKENGETKPHIVEDASLSNPVARDSGSAQVEQLLGLVNIDESSATLDFDLTESRGVGHLYSKQSAFTGASISASATPNSGDKLTLGNDVFTFGTANFVDMNGGGAHTVKIGTSVADAMGNLASVIGDPYFGATYQVVGYTSGDTNVVLEYSGSAPVVVGNITFVANAQQPELYWENIKIAKWTGSAYAFGTDLQAAYNSSSADVDLPSILVANSYDLDIQLDGTTKFVLKSDSSDFDSHQVVYQDSATGRGLAFQDDHMVALESISYGSPVRSSSISKIALTIDNANIGGKTIAIQQDTNKNGTFAAMVSITEGATADFNAGADSEETAQAIAQTLNGNNNFNTEAFAEAEGDKVFITTLVSTGNLAGSTTHAELDESCSAYSSNGVSAQSQKIITGLLKANAASDDCIGVVAKDLSQGDSGELLVPGQLFEPNMGSSSVVFGDEIFVNEGASAGECMGSSSVSGLTAGSYIFSLGYIVALQSESGSGGAARSAGTSKPKAVYMPRFVALLPA